MGKRKSTGSSLQIGPAERKERTLLNEVERQRASLFPAQYLDWCRRLCRQPGGLEFSSVRAVVWRDLLLTGAPSVSVPYLPPGSPATPNCHEAVLDCDIQRSLWHLFPDDALREEKRAVVKTTLARVFSHRKELHYYQGLHEVVGFMLHAVGGFLPRETFVAMIDQFVCRHLWVFCHEEMKASESVLYGVHFVVKQHRADVASVLQTLELGPGSHYALSWLLTWLTHHMSDQHSSTQVLARIFDVVLSGDEPRCCKSTVPATPKQNSGDSTALRSLRSVTSSVSGVVSRALLRSHSWAADSPPSATRCTPASTVQRQPSTMMGCLCAAIVVDAADDVMRVAESEMQSVDDITFAFGRVFAYLSSLPQRLASADAQNVESVLRLAVQMHEDVVPGRYVLLQHQERFCRDRNLTELSTAIKAELSSRAPAGHVRLPAKVAKACVTLALLTTLAATNYAYLTQE